MPRMQIEAAVVAADSNIFHAVERQPVPSLLPPDSGGGSSTVKLADGGEGPVFKERLHVDCNITTAGLCRSNLIFLLHARVDLMNDLRAMAPTAIRDASGVMQG